MGIPTALMAVSTGMSAIGQIQQGQAAAASSKYNAKVAMNNAVISRQNEAYAGSEGESATFQQGMKNRAIGAAIQSEQAAKGIDTSSGSASVVQESAASRGMLDALTIRSNAARKAYGIETEAVGFESKAALERATAKQQKTAGYMAAAGTVLGGGYQANKDGMLNSSKSPSASPPSSSSSDYYDWASSMSLDSGY